MSNTIKDLLRDLATGVIYRFNSDKKDPVDMVEEEVEEYYNRFIKEISKYFELGVK